MLRGELCDHRRGCKRKDLTPQFTMAIKEMRRGDVQPQFYCPNHQDAHPRVSPITGKPIERR